MPLTRPVVIAVDFDGTLAQDDFPHVGVQIGAFPWLRRIKEEPDIYLVLWTCRTGTPLQEAVDFCVQMGVEFDSVNEHSPLGKEFVNPGRKIGADIYIDDKALGCPLRQDSVTSKPYADWDIIGPEVLTRIDLLKMGLIR